MARRKYNDNINDNNDSVSSNEQLELSPEHPITHSDNQEQELAQFTPQSTPNPKSQHSSTEPNSHKPFPSQEHPHQFNSAFIKETPTPETEPNLLKDDSSYKNKTQHKPQFIPPETVMSLDTPINPLTPHSYPNNIITLINEKLNSLVNAINTFDTGVFVFNIQNGQIANEQRYQSTNELYKALKDEHEHEYANDLRICDAEQNSFAPVCKDTTRGSNENMVTKENDFSLIEEQRDKGTNAEASINKVVNVNTICSLINFTYTASCVRDLNLRTLTPRLFQSHSSKKPTHIRTHSNPVMDGKTLHFYDGDIQAVANEIAYKEISMRKQSKQLSDSCTSAPADKEVHVHSFTNMKVSHNEVTISQTSIKKENHNECQRVEGFNIHQDKVFRNISVAPNEVNVSEISKVNRIKQSNGVSKRNVVSKEITFEIEMNGRHRGGVNEFKNLNVVSNEVNVKQVSDIKRVDKIIQDKVFNNLSIASNEINVVHMHMSDINQNDSLHLNEVCRNRKIDIASNVVNLKYIPTLKQENKILQEKAFTDMQIVSNEVNITQIAQTKRMIHQEKAFTDMQVVSKEVNVIQMSESKHVNPQHDEFKDMQIVSNEVNVNHITTTNNNDNSTKDQLLKHLKIISNEIEFNHISTSRDTDGLQDKSFKYLDIMYNEINIHHLSSEDQPTITPSPKFEPELIHELTIKQQRNYNNTNTIQDIISITHPPSYSKQLPSTFELKSIETLTIVPKTEQSSTKPNLPALSLTQTQTLSFLHSKAFTNIDIISNQITITHSSSREETTPNFVQPHSPLTIQPNQTLTLIHENSFANIDIISNESSFNHVPQYKPLIHLLKQTQPQQFAIHQRRTSIPKHIEITRTELNIQQVSHQLRNNTPNYQEQSEHSFNIVPTVNSTSLPLQYHNDIDNFSFAISGNSTHEYKLLTIKHRHSLKFSPRNKKHVVITQQKLARFIIKPKKKKNVSIPVQSTSFECQQDKLANALKLLQQEQITSNVNYLPKQNIINNVFMKMCVAFMVITLMTQMYTKNKHKIYS